MRKKKGKILVAFFLRTHYTFGNICYGHLGRFNPQTVLLSYGYA